MQVNFEELKTLYRSLDVNVDDLVPDGKQVKDEVRAKSCEAFNRLELASRLAAELCKYRSFPFDKN